MDLLWRRHYSEGNRRLWLHCVMSTDRLSRRTVVMGAGAAAVGAGLAACSGSGAGEAAPSSSAPAAGKALANVADVPVGSVFPFTNPADGQPAFLLQPTEGTILAYSAVCTHQGCAVKPDDMGFTCPCHGATYDKSGQVTGGPATRSLAAIAVTVDAASGDIVLA